MAESSWSHGEEALAGGCTALSRTLKTGSGAARHHRDRIYYDSLPVPWTGSTRSWIMNETSSCSDSSESSRQEDSAKELSEATNL
tara:strand:+ start:2202 stop:2456 length:255 start_codon:yes stop_codon:yes gene_type:complete